METMARRMETQWKSDGKAMGNLRERNGTTPEKPKKTIGNAIKSIVASADPEYQPVLRNNIILSGGGSLIDGIADAVANEIADIGDVTVTCVDEPIDKVALGALALAQDMPDEQYTAIN